MARYIYDSETGELKLVSGLVDIDTTPTQGSTHAVQSGGVFNELAKKANITQIDNPNLLDNPWFTVNQRKFTSTSNLIYTVDRWKNGYGNFTVTLSNGMITLTKGNDSAGSFFMQALNYNDIKELLGKVVTESVMLSDGSIVSETFTLPNSFPETQKGFGYKFIGNSNIEMCLFFNPTTQSIQFRFNTTTAGATITIRAVKLEVGSVSTLAMDTIPNYAIESAKCRASKADSTDTYANQGEINVGTPNSNILINPWFTVNQRGFTTATSASNTYVADRWKTVSASGITITNDANGITIDNTNGSGIVTLETLLESDISKSLLGRTVTMSLSKVIGETDAWKTLTMPDSLPQSSTVISSVNAEEYTLRTVITGNGYVKVDVQVKKGENVTIRAIKLEIGNVSTLARDTHPDASTELLKCQRYFQNIVNTLGNVGTIGVAFGVSSTSARFPFYLPQHFRSNPTISLHGTALLTPLGSGSAITVTSIANYGLIDTSLNIRVDVASGLTVGTPYSFQLQNGSYIELSAEL